MFSRKIIALDNRLDLGEVVVIKERTVKSCKQASILWKLMNVGASHGQGDHRKNWV